MFDSATGMPIPFGSPVIWGQVELRGLRSNETKPTIFVTLLVYGAQVARAQANSKGYFYMLERIRDGAVLLVTVGGDEVGRQPIFAGGGERFDFTVNWAEGSRPAQQINLIRYAYPRSEENERLFQRASASKIQNKNLAIDQFNELLTADPKDFVSWTEVGSLYFDLSKYAEAAKAYKNALEVKPDYFLALMNMGKLQMTTKEYNAAVKIFEEAAISDPTSAEPYHYLGETYLQLKQGSKAVVVLSEALRLDPIGKAEIHLRLATLYNAAGAKDRAAAEYKKFIEKRPDYTDRLKLEKYIKENLK